MLSIEKQILYLISRAKEIKVKELVQLYTTRGHSGQYIRNVLFQLKKMGYIESRQRSTYTITEVGHSFVQSFNQKPNFVKREWNQTWQIVLFEFPETVRKLREPFRIHLCQLGFGHLYDSVYISPWDFKENIEQYVRDRKIAPYVTIAEHCSMPEMHHPQKVERIWSLDKLVEAYEQKNAWFLGEFVPSVEPLAGKEDTEIFLQFLILGEVISELGLIDPMLPSSLLPADWKGAAVIEQLFSYLHRIAASIPRESAYYKFVQVNSPAT